MWFDAEAALAKMKPADCAAPPATSATSATKSAPTAESVADVAKVAGGRAQIPKTDHALICDAIEAGRRRPGSVASATRLGATVTYQLIDRLIAEGRVAQNRDGTLSVKGTPNV